MNDEDFRDKQIFRALNLEEISVKRIQACFKLMNIADKKSINAIVKVLKDDSCELVRHEAAFCLGEMASEDVIEDLKESLEKDPSVVVKHECLVSLGTIGSKKDLNLIEKYLNSDNLVISASAKIAIERINQTDFFEIEDNEEVDDYILRLVDLLLDKGSNQNDKIQIMFILMNYANENIIDAISMILEGHKCPVVRHEAAFCLGEISNKFAIRKLKFALDQEKDDIVIHEILFALGTTANESTLKTLKKYTDDKKYIISESAKIAMDRINLIQNPYNGVQEYNYLNYE